MLLEITLLCVVALSRQCASLVLECIECDESTGKKCIRCDPKSDTPFLMETPPGNEKNPCVQDCTQTPGYYNDASDAQNKKCKKCAGNQKPNTAGDKCFSCSDENCERCDSDNNCARCSNGESPGDKKCPVATNGCHSSCDKCTSNAVTNQTNQCTSCKEGLYLKPNSVDGKSGVCLTAGECTFYGTHFTKEKAGDSKRMCLSCSDVTHGIVGCKKCFSKTLSGKTELTVVCSECTGLCLSPLGDACLDGCPDGTYSGRNNDNIGICAPCHNSCASCEASDAETSCMTCYPGAVLSHIDDDTGKCIPECTEGFTAHCKAGGCSLNVGGSKYCDQCEDGYAPIDGVCTEVSSTARDASGCKASSGKCTTCSGSYALLSGGRYDTNRVPGSSVCEKADGNGNCTTCANGQKYTDGNCPSCSEGCEQCTTNTNQCETCYPGYYRTGTGKCFKCAANGDNGIKGVPNCVSCAPPASGSGPVTCYLKTDGTNRRSLSTGVIAGVSILAVIVVGGLVGFLCWWLLHKKKA